MCPLPPKRIPHSPRRVERQVSAKPRRPDGHGAKGAPADGPVQEILGRVVLGQLRRIDTHERNDLLQTLVLEVGRVSVLVVVGESGMVNMQLRQYLPVCVVCLVRP
jgi:hypothetical protein